MICKFCNNEFSTKTNLNFHQNSAKYCLKIQGIEIKNKNQCKWCNKSFTVFSNFERHKKVCKDPNQLQEYKDKIEAMNEEMTTLRETVKVIKKENEMLRKDKKDLQESYKELSLTAVSVNSEDENTSKVDIANTTSYKKLEEENKEKNIKIKYLTKKYVKAQPRIQYKERHVVYILTTERMEKDRVYILGKAINLTSRLSTYNKSDEHKVVYYQECGDEETMGCVENMVFQYLKEYREQANRERFILPEKEQIGLFSKTINKSVEFFKK